MDVSIDLTYKNINELCNKYIYKKLMYINI